VNLLFQYSYFQDAVQLSKDMGAEESNFFLIIL